MNSIVILFVLCSVIFGLTSGAPSIGLRQSFTLKDLEPILSNPRLIEQYIKCVLREGPCTPDGKQFRDGFPLAVETACDACTETEKEIVRTAARQVYLHDPASYKKIVKKFDPDRKYEEKFIEFITKDE